MRCIITHCKIFAASYIPIPSVLASSIDKIISPGKIPALLAGPPGAAEITTKPVDDPSRLLG